MKWLLGIGITALGVLSVMAFLAWRQMTDAGMLRTPVFETEAPPVPALRRPAVLVFSKTNAAIHAEAIPAAKGMLQALAIAGGWSIYTTDSGAVFNARDLARFDVMVWNNVTGDVLLPEQRYAMRDWVERGGGFVGIHATGDNSHDAWPWFRDTLIRARYIGRPLDPPVQPARVRFGVPRDPLLDGLGEGWDPADEWFSFRTSPRAADLRVLATVDESTYTPGSAFGKSLAMGPDHPVIWKHCVGSGRVFYSAMGHTAQAFTESGYRELLARAVAWAGRFGPASPALSGTALGCELPRACPQGLTRPFCPE